MAECHDAMIRTIGEEGYARWIPFERKWLLACDEDRVRACRRNVTSLIEI